MNIENVKSLTGMAGTRTVSGGKTESTSETFAQAVKARKEDAVILTQKSSVEKKTGAAVGNYAGDPYNKGIPCGRAAEKVLDILAGLRETSEAIDYTGMSDEEIFRVIYSRYDRAFGGNLGGAASGALNVFMDEGGGVWRSINIGSQMYDEIAQHVSAEASSKIKKGSLSLQNFETNALYGHMTEEERMEYISKKYPAKNQTTLEYCSYLHDMSRAGLIPEKEAFNLINNATIKTYYSADLLDGKYLSTEFFERAASLSVTVRAPMEDRFSAFLSGLAQEGERMRYDAFLDDFLERISGYRE